MTSPVLGLLLAAGAGRRMGKPKAIVVDGAGAPWLTQQLTVLLDAGCTRVLVVLGSAAAEARALLPASDDRVEVVLAVEWDQGMSASLRAGLAAARDTDATAVVITLVDLPGLPVAAVRRLIADAGEDSLRQATYGGRPGHPVLIGRVHWEQLAAQLSGDVGARAYLAEHGARLVECSDLWDGNDVDRR